MSITPSNASDFTAEEATIELPRRNAAGAVLRVRIRAISIAQVQAFWKGMPSADNVVGKATPKPPADGEEQTKRMRDILRAGLVEPTIAFDDGDLGIPEANIHPENIAAICTGIMVHSGVGVALGSEAEALLNFRYVERGGVAIGGGDRGPVPPATPAE